MKLAMWIGELESTTERYERLPSAKSSRLARTLDFLNPQLITRLVDGRGQH